MQLSRRTVMAAWTFGLVLPRALAAEPPGNEQAMDLNPWTRFGVGSWKQVRVFLESLKNGKVETTNVREAKTTLVEVTDVDYQLRVEMTVEVAGRKFTPETKYLRQGFHGEPSGQKVEIKELGTGDLLIDGRKYPTVIRQVISRSDEGSQVVSLVHWNGSVAPHILKRESKLSADGAAGRNSESVIEVVAVDMPYRILTESRTVSFVKSSHRSASGGSTIAMEVHCADVPGGLVAQTSRESDSTGQIVSRETMEILEYQVVPIAAEAVPAVTSGNGRRRLFQRTNRSRSGS